MQRFGLCIEYLVSILALCHHASVFDPSQQAVAVLQCQVLKDKYDAIKLLGSARELARLRTAIAVVGDRIEADQVSLFEGLDPEPFAHPWDENGGPGRT